MRKTIITDLDGTLIQHLGSYTSDTKPTLLPGVREQINTWLLKDYYIVIATGRKESYRKVTEELLNHLNIPFDQLLMGLSRGPRVLLNDLKPGVDTPTAEAINLERNKGLEDLDI